MVNYKVDILALLLAVMLNIVIFFKKALMISFMRIVSTELNG